MKKRRFSILPSITLLLLFSFCASALCGCKITAGKLDFTISNAQIASTAYGDYARITVTTTCTGGRIYDPTYPHGIEGGNPVLILEDGTELEFGINVTMAVTTLDMKKGDYVECTWEFWIPEDASYDLSEGEYTVRVEWLGKTEIIQGVRFAVAA